jgi:hypothetical protein
MQFSRGIRSSRKIIPWLLFFATAAVIAVCLYCSRGKNNGGHSYLLIEHARLIDSAASSTSGEVTILIAGQQIKSIGVSSPSPDLPNVARIDAKGKFLIAGLWDMHVHTLSKGLPDRFLPLFIANGVTGVRDMGGDLSLEQIQHLKGEILGGARIGPEIFAPGPILEGEHPFWPFSIAVKNEIEAIQAVSSLVKQKADFVKVYNTLSRNSYLAIAASARETGIAFAGHVPATVTPAEASDLGQRSIEHLWGIPLYCAANPDELRRMSAKADNAENAAVARGLYYKVNETILSSYDKSKAAALFARFDRNGTWQVPTLVVLRSYAEIHDLALRNDPRLAYIPDDLRKDWDSMGGTADKRNDELQKRLFEHDLEIVRAMHGAGVPLLAGTDTPNPFTYPGFSLHDELQLLVTAGLSSRDALDAATRRAAQFLGVERDFGTVEEGKIANLVLLDENPLTDIGNTKKIRAVIFRGQYLDRATLDDLLSPRYSPGKVQ